MHTNTQCAMCFKADIKDRFMGRKKKINNNAQYPWKKRVWADLNIWCPNKCDCLKPLHMSACVVLRLAALLGRRGMVSEALGGQRLLNECTSGAEKRLRGQGRFENSFWRALLFHYSRDSLIKSLPLCPPAIQRLCMLIANKACTSL